MSAGIRAEIRVDPGGSCPVARLTAAADTACTTIRRSVNPTDPSREVVEFVLEDRLDTAAMDTVDVDVEPVFEYGEAMVYRFERERGSGCPCECLAEFDVPITDQFVRDEELSLTFHAPDIETLQDLVGTLSDRYESVDVRRLLRTEGDRDDHELVFVDRNALTERQREAIRTAHELGYFDHPKGANAQEVAETLGVSRPTFSEHLAAAQSKLLDAVFGDI
jgi:hypothetical protein